MRIGVGSALDPYILGTSIPALPGWVLSRYAGYHGRTQVHPALVPGEVTKGILIMGDSIAGNSTSPLYTVSESRNHTLSVCNGGVYVSADPMLGTTGAHADALGAFATRIGDNLISGGHCERAVMCSIAVGSSRIGDWAVGGTLNGDVGAACRRFSSVGIPIDAVIWPSGRNDAADGTSQVDYTARLNSLIATIRTYLPTTPILVGILTDLASPNAAVRAALASVVNHSAQIWEGVDADAYPSDHFDGHFTAIGSAAVAADYVTALQAAGVV